MQPTMIRPSFNRAAILAKTRDNKSVRVKDFPALNLQSDVSIVPVIRSTIEERKEVRAMLKTLIKKYQKVDNSSIP